jgi:hypothetical protein
VVRCAETTGCISGTAHLIVAPIECPTRYEWRRPRSILLPVGCAGLRALWRVAALRVLWLTPLLVVGRVAFRGPRFAALLFMGLVPLRGLRRLALLFVRRVALCGLGRLALLFVRCIGLRSLRCAALRRLALLFVRRAAAALLIVAALGALRRVALLAFGRSGSGLTARLTLSIARRRRQRDSASETDRSRQSCYSDARGDCRSAGYAFHIHRSLIPLGLDVTGNCVDEWLCAARPKAAVKTS